MTRSVFLEKLFDAHAFDLNSVYPKAGEIFVCPICRKEYTKKDLAEDKLTTGDVWPRYLRSKSKAAKLQRILLCAKCNHTAGSKGDKHIQLVEKIRDVEKSGNLGNRTIKIFEKMGEPPIVMNTGVDLKSEKQFTITGKIDKNKKWLGNDPKMQERFEKLVARRNRVTVQILPTAGVSPHLGQIGWITSAYLFAFYSLGYRYILREELQTVRDYILKSFDERQPSRLSLPVSLALKTKRDEKTLAQDPNLNLVIPIDGQSFVHLEVNFLNYQVELPFFFVPDLLTWLIYQKMPNLREKLEELLESDSFLFVPITCTKVDEHECVFDYLMGKPLNN